MNNKSQQSFTFKRIKTVVSDLDKRISFASFSVRVLRDIEKEEEEVGFKEKASSIQSTGNKEDNFITCLAAKTPKQRGTPKIQTPKQ